MYADLDGFSLNGRQRRCLYGLKLYQVNQGENYRSMTPSHDQASAFHNAFRYPVRLSMADNMCGQSCLVEQWQMKELMVLVSRSSSAER